MSFTFAVGNLELYLLCCQPEDFRPLTMSSPLIALLFAPYRPTHPSRLRGRAEAAITFLILELIVHCMSGAARSNVDSGSRVWTSMCNQALTTLCACCPWNSCRSPSNGSITLLQGASSPEPPQMSLTIRKHVLHVQQHLATPLCLSYAPCNDFLVLPSPAP